MAELPSVQALFPIGKTQWLKWTDAQRIAFNEARAAGVPYAEAIQGANQTQPAKPHRKLNITDIFHKVEDVAETVASVAAAVTPVAAVAETVVKVAKGKPRTKKGK